MGSPATSKLSDASLAHPVEHRTFNPQVVGSRPTRRTISAIRDGLYAELKSHNLPASELLQVAVRAEIERRVALDATDEYSSDLAAEVGEPSARDRARARAIVRRIRDRHIPEAG